MFNYVAGPEGLRFLESRADVKLIMGPVGSGKSTVALMECLQRSIRQKPYFKEKDAKGNPRGVGIRYTKCIILRNTMAQLTTTVKPTIDEWFIKQLTTPLGKWKTTEHTFEMRFKLKDGTIVEADLMMMAADTPDDVRRLLSVQASFGWAEEGREIDPVVFEGFQGRMNRYPSKAMGGVTYPGVIISTNPPPLGGYWHKMITEPPKTWQIFIQPPAFLEDNTINPETENLEHLADDYYEKLIEGKTQEWINVYLKNQFGSGGQGLPIFRSSWRPTFHRSREDIKVLYQTLAPIIIGMDNGLTAAAVFGQLAPTGRVNIIDECYVPHGVTMGVERFLDTILLPKLANEYPNVNRSRIIFVVDPACFERSQVNEKTIAMAVQQRGFQCVKSPITNNDPEKRVAAAEGLLARAIDGGPGLLVASRCKHLSAALEWGYRYKPTKDPMAPLVIDKNFYSHIAEAFEYLCSHYNVQTDVGLAMFKSKAREVVAHRYIYT